MGGRSKYPYEEKMRIVEKIIKNKASIKMAAQETNASRRSIREWVSLYKSMGKAGLMENSRHKQYSEEIKLMAVKEYLTGKASLQEICCKYQIRSTLQLRDWIKKYNSHKPLKTTGTGGTVVAKSRKTSYEERVEIVKACIEQGHNYTMVSQAYKVSYQQARSWTLKYEQLGVEALQDRRGKRKNESEMNETEKLRAKIRLKEAENLRLRMENDLLKKLAELERGEA